MTSGPGYPQPHSGYENLHYSHNHWAATSSRQPCALAALQLEPGDYRGPRRGQLAPDGSRGAESFIIINDSTNW